MNRVMRKLPKAVVVLIGAVTAVLFVVLINVAGLLASPAAGLPGYGYEMVGELLAAAGALLFLFAFGYAGALKKTKGFFAGLYVGGFMTGYCFLELTLQIYVRALDVTAQIVSPLEIFFFIATMFLIGFAEEAVFRGVILNLFLERFSGTKRGVLCAVIFSGVIFGAMHMTNAFQGVSLFSAFVQAVNASLLGVIFGAVYVRTKNLWLVVFFHALTDFASLLTSGLYGDGSTVDQINEYSALNFILSAVLLIPCVILLRPKKLEEAARRENGFAVFEDAVTAKHDGAMSIALGIISIVCGGLGLGFGIGLAGLAASRVSARVNPMDNSRAKAGMVLSIIGMAESAVATAIWYVIYAFIMTVAWAFVI